MNTATHKGKNGTLYKKEGKFWKIWRSDAWWVCSGIPPKLERI